MLMESFVQADLRTIVIEIIATHRRTNAHIIELSSDDDLCVYIYIYVYSPSHK